MSQKLKEIPYKVYRAKLSANTKDANENNNNTQSTTNRSARTGFTTNRSTLTASVKPISKVNQQKTMSAADAIGRKEEAKKIEISKSPTIDKPLPLSRSKEKLIVRESARATTRSVNHKRSQSTEESKRQPIQPRARKKRSQSAVNMNTTAQKTALEKEAIKKRLEELRQNTRKIICKNVQKKKLTKDTHREQAIVEPKQETILVGNMNFMRPTPRVQKPAPPAEPSNIDEAKSDKSPRLLPQPERKMGIMRKPEYKDHSYSALKDIDCNKENFLTHAITPNRTVKHLPATLSPAPGSVIATKDAKVQVNGTSLKTSARLESELTSAGRLAQSGQKSNLHKECWQHAENRLEAVADLPYWLRPTSVQIYPYNFIKAVRRKLEAVTNTNTNHLEKAHIATSTSALHNLPINQSTMCDIKQKSSSLRSLNIKPTPAVRSQSCSSSKQLQSLESNFSSISIQLPASANTVSEVSSLASEVHDSGAHSQVESLPKVTSARNDDDTTVSSSILSNVEMEVKSVSPLNLEKIDKLQIESKSSLEKPIDMNKFLQDFNRSLSKVIEVNAQLKSTLDKSHSISDTKKGFSKNQQENVRAQDELISTEYENELFTKMSSTTTIGKENGSSQNATLNVLSPNTINNSYERSKSLKSSPEQANIEKSEMELRTEKRRQLMETHVNMNRGDFQRTSNFESEDILTEVLENASTSEKEAPKESVELTLNLSEESTNFYNTSVYEKLLQKGVSQEDCLRACLKIREKFILDRSKSQIALLEIQKERFKSKGLLEQLTAIKKKQRAIILKMEREREEIQR